MTAPIIYDALIVGAGPAGLAAALALSRVCRTSMLFDSGEFRNEGAKEIHNLLSRDGTPPTEFRATCFQQLEKYKDYSNVSRSKIVQIANTDVLPGYKGFKAIDSTKKEFFGRKLLLATGTVDVLPTEFEGYKENWPAHM